MSMVDVVLTSAQKPLQFDVSLMLCGCKISLKEIIPEDPSKIVWFKQTTC